MQYKTLVQFVQAIINSIQTTGVAGVKEIKRYLNTTILKVHVQNPQEKVTVQGGVQVTNQAAVEKKITTLTTTVKELKKALKPYKEIRVQNFPKFPKFPEFPKFPTVFKVSNFPTETKISNLGELKKELQSLNEEITKLELSPQINVAAPVVNVPAPVVNIPKVDPPIVNVEKPDLSELSKIMAFLEGIGAKSPLAVQLSDGKAFYKALEKMADIYAGSTFSAFQDGEGNDGRAMLNARNELRTTVSDTWDVNDVEKVSATLTYFGEETADGFWRVREVRRNSALTAIRHATKRNNENYNSYEEAWGDRASLTYGYAREAL